MGLKTKQGWVCVLAVAVAGFAAGCGTAVEEVVHPPENSYTSAPFTIGIQGASEKTEGALVTPAFFTGVPVRPFVGRFFTDQEYSRDKSAVAVLSHRYWTERFQTNPAVVGSVVELNGQRVTIIGIAPPQFRPERAGNVWVPKTAEAP